MSEPFEAHCSNCGQQMLVSFGAATPSGGLLRDAASRVLWMYDNHRIEAIPEAAGEAEDDMNALRAALARLTEDAG